MHFRHFLLLEKIPIAGRIFITLVFNPPNLGHLSR